MKQHVDLHNARPGPYEKLIKKIVSDKVCPFCKDNLRKYHQKPLIKENRFWFLTTNQHPYKGSKYHFLAINKKHKENFESLTSQEMTGLLILFKWVIKKYKLPGGAIFMRFGQTSYTGASVVHLHAHLIVGIARNKKNSKKILNVPLGYKVID